MKVAHIILLGMTNSGKSTHVPLVLDAFEKPLQIIYPGQLLRDEINAGTEIGTRIARTINSGVLSNDDAVFEIVRRFDLGRDTLLDGYPRDPVQGENYLSMISALDKTVVPMIIFFKISPDDAMQRAIARAGAQGRDDDKMAVTKTKISEFQTKTVPTINMLCNMGFPLHVVDVMTRDIINNSADRMECTAEIREFFRANGF